MEGDRASAVRVVAYEDLECGDCAAYRRMLDELLLPKYKKEVAFEHRDFPLPKHKWARQASIAARHFDRTDPELGVAFRKYAMQNRTEITAENFTAKVRAFAQSHRAETSPPSTTPPCKKRSRTTTRKASLVELHAPRQYS